MEASSDKPSTDRRSQILREALTLFAERGIDGTGLRDIAKKVGITQPSLYHYFPSKEALIEGIIEWHNAAISKEQEKTLLAISDSITLRQGLHRMAENMLRAWEQPDTRAFQRVMMGELARGGPLAQLFQSQFLAQRRVRASQLFTALIAAGKVRDLDPELLALQMIGPILFVGTLRNVDERLTQERMRELVFQHLETFIRGIERT